MDAIVPVPVLTTADAVVTTGTDTVVSTDTCTGIRDGSEIPVLVREGIDDSMVINVTVLLLYSSSTVVRKQVFVWLYGSTFFLLLVIMVVYCYLE